MLIALTDIIAISISASYVNDQLNTAQLKTLELFLKAINYSIFRISQLSIDIARECKDLTRTIQETAYLVEICKCPKGMLLML